MATSPAPRPGNGAPQPRDGMLKYAWRNLGIRQLVLDLRFDGLAREWRSLVRQVRVKSANKSRILIVPSDPELLTASTGDQAMIGAIMSHWRAVMPEATFFAAVSTERAAEAAKALGMTPVAALDPKDSLADSLAMLADLDLGTIVAMGADVLDGSYNVAFSGRQVMLIDLLSRGGSTVFVTGFSVSKTFKPRMMRLFDASDPAIRISLRDPVSLDRFRAACRREAHLVTDVAFLLEPRESTATQRLGQWIEDQRQVGRIVLGVNCHPLLLELEMRGEIGCFVAGFADALAALADRRELALVMLDHDRRGTSSDILCLEPVHARLSQRIESERLLFPDVQMAADEIKAVAGKLDGVISGRMHLMIAALGAGTPVFGIDYKDKMEGLLGHFGLPTEDLCTAADFMRNDTGPVDALVSFVDGLEQARARVRQAKPTVRAAALRNFGEAA